MFNEYYTSVAQNILQDKLPITNADKTNLSSNQCSSMFVAPVRESEIMYVIENMKNKNSYGIDEIPNCFIKTCLTIILPLCLHNKLVTINWQFSRGIEKIKVKSLHKKNTEIKIVNYRHVSLLLMFSKIHKRIMHNRLISYFNKYNTIVNMKHGFLKENSINTAIINFIKNVYNSVDNKKISIGLFLEC
jgi:hypothetical protein